MPRLLLLILALAITAAAPAAPAAPEMKYRYALLGNPVAYPEWTEERLRALKDAGFNAIQLNIAWLRRPNDEALNLNDVVTAPGDQEATRTAERRTELQRRCALAVKVGLRPMFHFGSPFMWRNPETGEIKRQSSEAYQSSPPWFDVQNPKVVAHETALLKEFRRQFPDVQDILVYTYDQDAWQTSEWGSDALSRGVPLHKRLPAYLQALHQAWTEGRPDGDNMMWWEPWELSAGQVYACMPQLPANQFGLMLHNNIAEVQVSMPVDVWFRNTARMAAERGIPVVGEGFFGSATEEIEPLSFPFPRLTDEQYLAMRNVPGVVGVKEYFGVLTDPTDLNLEIFTARTAHPDATTSELLHRITARFGPRQPRTLQLLEEWARAMQMFPWDVSWYARLAGTANPDHGWNAAFIRGQQVETPSWESTRRAHFMVTTTFQPHPFLIEDIQLRCEQAVQHLDNASSICRELLPAMAEGADRTMFEKALGDADKFRRVAQSYALHLRMTNVAMLMRADIEEGRPEQQRLVDELRRLLQQDVQNQGPDGQAAAKLEQFQADPKAFVRTNLKPVEGDPREKGIFTLTTR